MACHSRILEFPHTRSLVNAHLDDLRAETRGSRRELICDYRELRLAAAPELMAVQDQPHKRLRGEYVSRCLRFRGLRWIKRSGIFTQLSDVPPGSEMRQLEGLLCWRSRDGVEYCLLLDRADAGSGLLFSARDCVTEKQAGPAEPIEIVRDWSPPPLLPARLVPKLQGKRVLVHCSAGFNRSVTVCCTVLMRLETLSAEEALTRVREHHPWARPDSHHWLRLRWMAHTRML
jgi:hypothetical protein